MLKDYYELTKPGIIYGNAVLFVGGFALALEAGVMTGNTSVSVVVNTSAALMVFIAGLIGLSLVIASGCVFNNYIDRGIDAKMERTKDRPLVIGRVAARPAIIYGIMLGVLGFLILAIWTNLIAVAVVAVGFFFYVFMYSLWAKRRTMYAVVVGAVAGAVPPVAGYAVAGDRLDFAAGLLFLILVLWQLPHFFAISIRRSKDYAAAGVPILPNQHGNRATKIIMAILILAFTYAAVALSALGYADVWYGIVASLFGFAWLVLAVQGFGAHDDVRFARRMFLFSLVVLMALFITMTIGALAAVRFS